jgi:hypothetical protein
MNITNHTAFDTRALRAAICAVHDQLAKTEGRLPQWKSVHVEVVYARTRITHGCAALRGTYMKLVLQGPRPIQLHRGHSGSRVTDSEPLLCSACGGGHEVFRKTGSDGRRRDDGEYEMLHQHWQHDCKVKAPSRVTPQHLAALLDHEIRHLYGIHHDKMPGIYTKTMWRLEYDAAVWANDHPAFPWTHLPAKAARKRAVQSPVERIGAKLALLGEREKRWTTKLKRAQTALAKLRQAKRYHERRLAAHSKETP